jgi:hypothetical protein
VNGTAFKVAQTGEVTFIAGQTFPGAGTITGITTATGSGLSGGGTKGTLSLKVPAAGITNAMLVDSKITLNASTAGGLTVPGATTLGDTYTIGLKTCAASQILEYSGTAWNCSSLSSGTGTITGVTAGTDLTGGGTSGSVTLNVDTTNVPQLKTANTFTGNQSVTGNVSATGQFISTGTRVNSFSGGISSPLIETSNGTFLVEGTGFYNSVVISGDSGPGIRVLGSDSSGPAILSNATGNGETFGVSGLSESTVGAGVLGTVVSSSTEGTSYGGSFPAGVWGDTGVSYSSTSELASGVLSIADDNNAVVG